MTARLLILAVASLFAVAAAGQDVISARAGFINYSHGRVFLPTGVDGKSQRQMQEGQEIATGIGRVELLLAPGSFLRLDHESSARLVSSRLDDVQVELLSGTATLEVAELRKENRLTLIWREHSIPVQKTGLYRFEPNDGSMRVYVESGKLEIPGMKGALKGGRFVDVPSEGAVTAALKYNRKDRDEFDRWNYTRAYMLADASMRAAWRVQSRGFRSSMWYLDPFTGFATFLPYSGSVWSPFGFYFYSPRYIYTPSYGYSGGGSSGGRRASSGGSTGSSSPTISAPAPSAPRPSISAPPGISGGGGMGRGPGGPPPSRPSRPQ